MFFCTENKTTIDSNFGHLCITMADMSWRVIGYGKRNFDGSFDRKIN